MTPSEAGRSGGDERTLAGVTLDDRYVVSSTLGAGGMATVYLATDTRLDRSVVVKMPHTALAAQPDFLARFQREIASLTKIEHPHVVKVHDTGTFGGLPYAVLQHLSGGSLRDRLDKAGGKLAPAEILPWLLQVADALDHIHARGMVHRDVKPGNILYDDAGNVVLADFGIAKAMGHLDTGITATGVTPGSPGYMAPEVVKGGELGPGYDQFSLAVCVYEALAGRLPHEGRTPLELLTNLIHHSAADLAPLAPGIPPDAVSAVMKALSRDPTKRFATCTEFAKSFQQALGVPTMQVFPREFATAMRRRRWLRVGVAAGVIASAAGVGAFVARRGAPERSETAGPPTAAEAPPKRDLGETPWKLVTPPEGPSWARVSQQQVDEAKKLNVPVAFENPLGMRFVLIPAGKFVMGSPRDEPGRRADEELHEVEIGRAFYLSITETTNGQFRKFEPHSMAGSYEGISLDGDTQPAVMISFNGARLFCRSLSARDADHAYRLPCEAEWEYACRAGSSGRWYWGDDELQCARFENVCDAAFARHAPGTTAIRGADDGYVATAPVGNFLPNPWGLFDVLGNAGELCEPGDRPRPIDESPAAASFHEADVAVQRGAAFGTLPTFVRAANRFTGTTAGPWAQSTVRVVADLPQSSAPPKRDLGETPWKLVRPEGAPEGVLVSQTQIDEAKRLGVPVWFENSVGMRFVLIPAGKFVFGSSEDEPGRDPGELRAREVEMARPVYVSVFELTNSQYRTWNGNHHAAECDGYRDDSDAAVATGVRIMDAENFATHLSQADGRVYRLPTEIEWERACRAGTTGPRFWEGDVRDARRFANVADLSAKRRWPKWNVLDVDDGFEGLSPPGSFLANPWGLRDMIGNALEWTVGSSGDGGATVYVCRGASFDATALGVRCTARAHSTSDRTTMHFFGGIRLLADLPLPASVAVDEPRDGASLDEGLVSVRGTAPAAKTVRVNGVTGDVADGKFDVAITLPPGEQEIEVVAGTVSTIRKVKVTAVPRPEAGWPGVPAWAKVAKQQIDEAKRLGVPVAFENSLGMRFVLVPAGRFLMGSPEDEPGRGIDEAQHWVTLTRAYYCSIDEVTNGQFRAWDSAFETIRGLEGVEVNGDAQPVMTMTAGGAAAFAAWVGTKDSVHLYRVPREAEWERACRAGTRTKFFWGGDTTGASRYCNFADASLRKAAPSAGGSGALDDGFAGTSPVGRFAPNAWGLYDMLGNAMEFTADGYEPLPTDALVDPFTPGQGHAPVLRGGGFGTPMAGLRCACRMAAKFDRGTDTGFRLAADLPEKR